MKLHLGFAAVFSCVVNGKRKSPKVSLFLLLLCNIYMGLFYIGLFFYESHVTAMKTLCHLFLLFFICALYTQNLWAQNTKAMLAKADSLLEANQCEIAIEKYTEILKKQPANEMALRGKAYCYLVLGKTALAEKEYKKALKINPRCLRCEYHLIRILSGRGLTDAAILKADSCLKRYADTGKYLQSYFDIQVMLGELYEFKEDFVNAERVFNDVIAYYPDSAMACYAFARYNFLQGSKTTALKSIEKAIRLNNTIASFYDLKCKIYAFMNKHDEALKIIIKAISIDSMQAEYHVYKGYLLAQLQKFEEAKNAYYKGVALNPNNSSAYEGLSTVFHTQENMDSMCWCAKNVEKIVTKDSFTTQENEDYLKHQIDEYCNAQKPGYYYQRGIAMYNLALYDSALSYYTAGLKKFTNNAILYSFRGNAYMALQKWQNAATDYENALKTPDSFLETVNESYKNKDEKEKEAYYKNLISSSYFSLSEALLNLSNVQEAKINLEKALNTYFNQPDIPLFPYYNLRGRIYMAEGKIDSAIETFDYVIRLNPQESIGYINKALATVAKAKTATEKFLQIGLSATWNNINQFDFASKPVQLTKNQEVILKEAIAYCDKAIYLIPQDAGLYLVRAHIKQLSGLADFCPDIKQAAQMGIKGLEGFLLLNCTK